MEAVRLQALQSCEILDSASEPEFDDLASLAARLCETPIAFVCFVDRDRNWLKASVGLDASEVPRHVGLCTGVVEGNRPLVVNSLIDDRRFCDNPLVAGELHFRAYAGVPLNVDGQPVGVVGVVDRVPREFDDSRIAALGVLARQGGQLLELRRRTASLQQSTDEMRLEIALRQRAEDERKHARDLLKLALEHTRTCTWEYVVTEQSRRRIEPPGWLTVAATVDSCESRLEPAGFDPWVAAIHPHDRVSQRIAFAACVTGESTEYECEYRMRDGSDGWRWVLDRGRVLVRDPDARAVRIVGTATDVSARKQAEFELRDSDERYRRIYEMEADAICVFDVRTMELIDANPAAHALYEYPPDELFSLAAGDLAVNRFKVQRAFERVHRGETVVEPLVWHKRRNQSQIPVEVRMSGFQVNRRMMVCVVVRDLSERLKTELALRDSESLYRSLVEQLPMCFFRKDRDGRISFANQRFADFVELPVERVIGKTDLELFDRPSAERYRKDDEYIVQTGSVMEQVEQNRREGHPPRYVRVCKSPVVGLQGTIVGVQGVFADVTAEIHAEREHRRLNERMFDAQKMESLGLLAGGIAHDFNNLLMGVMGHSELAAAETPEGSLAQEHLRQVDRAAALAAELCNELLAYSGRGRFIVQAIDLRRLVTDLTHLLRAVIPKSASLEIRAFSEPVVVEVDAPQVSQIVMNLITNAADALRGEPGVVVLHCGKVRVSRDELLGMTADPDLSADEYAFLDVSDTGVGIDEDKLQRIFDPFYTTKKTGRGLGLAAVAGIVRSHRGAIHVESRPGRGTTFRILLPVTSKPLPDKPPMLLLTPGVVCRETILVVDDERVVRDVTRKTLERAGYRVLTADDGAEGVDRFREQMAEIDAVLLDLTMPRMNGHDAYRELRKLRLDVPVILSSGYHEREAALEVDQTPVDFIQKPYRPHILLGKVRNAIDVALQHAECDPQLSDPHARESGDGEIGEPGDGE